MAPTNVHTEHNITCPTCSTVIDINARCESRRGMLQCFENQGHRGWHWSQGFSSGITRWTGLHTVSKACPEFLGERDDWCIRGADHEGAHSNGRGTSWVPMEEDEDVTQS